MTSELQINKNSIISIDEDSRLTIGEDYVYTSTVIYAATSPSSYILESLDNGETWSNVHTSSNGDVTSFIITGDDSLWYGTSEGYIVNYVTSDTVYVTNPIVASISSDPDYFFIDSKGNGYVFLPEDNTWDLEYSYGFNDLLCANKLLVNDVAYGTTNGLNIQGYGDLGQDEPVVALGAYSDTTAFISYADDHIYKLIDRTLEDLGITGHNTTILLKQGNRLFFNTEALSIDSLYYTEDEFDNNIDSGLEITSTCSAMIASTNNVLLVGTNNGEIWRSNNNGDTWSSLGQQFGESSITSFLKI